MTGYSQETIQKLIDARSKSYGKAFEDLSAESIMSWQSKSTEFNDVAMDEFRMNFDSAKKFFTGAAQSMSSLKILEDSTYGTSPEFVTWEMLIEVTNSGDMPTMNIKKGDVSKIRGVAIQWWKWEGKGESWNGDLSEESIRGWKIVKENDYMLTLQGDRKAAQAVWLQ